MLKQFHEVEFETLTIGSLVLTTPVLQRLMFRSIVKQVQKEAFRKRRAQKYFTIKVVSRLDPESPLELHYQVDQEQVQQDAELDGVYLLAAGGKAATLAAADILAEWKGQHKVERCFHLNDCHRKLEGTSGARYMAEAGKNGLPSDAILRRIGNVGRITRRTVSTDGRSASASLPLGFRVVDLRPRSGVHTRVISCPSRGGVVESGQTILSIRRSGWSYRIIFRFSGGEDGSSSWWP